MIRRSLCLGLCVLAAACGGQDGVRVFAPDAYPERLSEWGIMDWSSFEPAPNNQVYDLTVPLFSDYAHKLRTLYLPPGTKANYHPTDSFDFPVGTVVSKTFLYEQNPDGRLNLQARWDGNPATLNNPRLIETRLLVKQSHGWDALPYVWQGDDAFLDITGELLRLETSQDTLNYLVPSRNQCASCHATNHTTGEIQPIGLKARHLNRAHPLHTANQLTAMVNEGRLDRKADEIPTNAHWTDNRASLSHRARSYLDINCGHCHNPQGAADTSGLLLDYQAHSLAELGQCKAPIAAGRGSGGRMFSIVPGKPEASIMTFRMESTNPAIMMPELGRSLVHVEGAALIRDWVASLEGECL